jgi:hypothetical protein
MTHFGKLMVAAMGALSLVAAGSATVLAHEEHPILQFDSMTPVSGAAVGPAVNDRGLTGGGVPWVITSGRGEVDRNGHVQVSVTGLIIPARGNNPIKKFMAIVSCVSQHHVIVNVSTDLFDATGAGDSTIDDTVALPRHCSHPILFVTNAAGAWFAMSNARDDEEGDD